jgi:glutaredoxin 3
MVKVYSTAACPYCTMAKQYLKDHGIEFEDLDVSNSQELAEEMIAKSGQMGVPVLEINGKIVIGFNKPQIAALLEIKG